MNMCQKIVDFFVNNIKLIALKIIQPIHEKYVTKMEMSVVTIKIISLQSIR